MRLQLGDIAPDFTAETTYGPIRFHDWIGDGWAVLFSHPKDFTPVCTTELQAMVRLEPAFARRNVKIIGLSVDTVEEHFKWIDDIEAFTGLTPSYPLIGDHDLSIAKLYGMLDARAAGEADSRTASDNATVRSVFVIGPDKRIELTICYPMSTGRNFDEILRVVDSLQLTADYSVATPADWRAGEDVVIAPTLSDEAAWEIFPWGWRAPRPYMRYVACPR